jgi:hypothetical protein
MRFIETLLSGFIDSCCRNNYPLDSLFFETHHDYLSAQEQQHLTFGPPTFFLETFFAFFVLLFFNAFIVQPPFRPISPGRKPLLHELIGG